MIRRVLSYSVVLVVVLSAFAATMVWEQGRVGARRVDRELEALTATLENVLRDEMSETGSPSAAAQDARATVATPGRPIAILDASGGVLATTGNAFAQNPEAFRVRQRSVRIDGYDFVLQAAAPLDDARRERREALQAMWIGMPVVLLLAVGGGLWLATSGPLVTQLREALRVQRQFMADASHELRTPVSVIQSAADVTLARDTRSAAEYRDSLAIVGTEARRLARLVDDMLVLARADAGGYPLTFERLYLNDLVADCRRALDVLARERAVTIRTVAGDDVPFTGDENLLRRMLLNLLQNAVSHTRPNGTVTVALSMLSQALQIRVSDEGDGIPESDRTRIFDRFVQLDMSRSRAGAGLGLPIARWIAEAHGGSLELETSNPRGSTFLVSLPT
jgi:two-component system, OmpR family, sensor kinase